jgi:tetratricopeptide (TPR) repeat protein
MIVKDEESRLERCLQSVQGIVDEIIVVDTGSRDRTPMIAQQFGAQVYDVPWQDDFAAARNQSLHYAQGEWILVLDADETFLPDCIPELRQGLQATDCIVLTLLRQEIGAQQNPYSLVSRLFRRHPAVTFTRPYHESIDDAVAALVQQEPHWQVHSLATPAIAHDGYVPNTIIERQKAERAERIMGQYLQAKPQDAYIGSKLGALYVSQGHIVEGLALLEQGLQCADTPAVVAELHYHLGLAYSAQSQIAQAQHHYEQALKIDLPIALNIAPAINLAALYTDHGAGEQAILLLNQLLQLQPNLAIAYYNLGLAYRAVGRFPEAITAYQQAIHWQPQYPEAYQNLGVVYFKLGRTAEALTAFQQAITLYTATHNPSEADRLRQALSNLGFPVSSPVE